MTADELVKLADTAMYQSKDHGQCMPVIAGPGSPAGREAVPDKR
jgi:GGDEF domain-containing protein